MKRAVKNIPLVWLGFSLFWIFVLSLEKVSGNAGAGAYIAQAMNTQLNVGLVFVGLQFIVLLGFPQFLQKLDGRFLKADFVLQISVVMGLFSLLLQGQTLAYVGLEAGLQGFSASWVWTLITLVVWSLLRLFILVRQQMAEFKIQKYLLSFYAFVVGLLALLVNLHFLTSLMGLDLLFISVHISKMFFQLLKASSLLALFISFRPSLTNTGVSFLNSDKNLLVMISSYFVGSWGIAAFGFNSYDGFGIVLLSLLLGMSFFGFFVGSLEISIKKMMELQKDFVLSGAWIPFLMIPISFIFFVVLGIYETFTFKSSIYEPMFRLFLLAVLPAILFYYKQVRDGHSNVTASISRALFFVGSTITLTIYVLMIRFGFSNATFELPAFLSMYKIMMLGSGFVIIAMATVLWDRFLYEII